MKELRSKKTGAIVDVVNDDEYKSLVDDGNIDMNKYIVTDLKMKTIIPSLKESPKEITEVKITKKTKK